MENIINLLVTLDAGYIHQLNVMLYSVLKNNPDDYFKVFVLHSSLTDDDLSKTRKLIESHGEVIPINAGKFGLEDAPTTDRYPTEMYYRIFAAKFLPDDVDKVLYLDPDIIVKGNLHLLYDKPLENKFYAAAVHVGKFIGFMNSVRIGKDKDEPYINSGVMLMNLAELRKRQNEDDVFQYINVYNKRLFLPDQDILSSLYAGDFIMIDPDYFNLTEWEFAFRHDSKAFKNMDWVNENTVIIHYCGRNKPWKKGYTGFLGDFYFDAEKEYTERMKEYE